MIVRLALISGLIEQRRMMRENLSLFGFETVYQGGSLSTHFKKLIKARPDVVILTTGDPNTFHNEIDPNRLQKLAKQLADTKLLIRTELKIDHPFVKEAIAIGVSVIDERSDWQTIARGIRRIVQGQHFVRYESEGRDLETYESRRSRER